LRRLFSRPLRLVPPHSASKKAQEQVQRSTRSTTPSRNQPREVNQSTQKPRNANISVGQAEKKPPRGGWKAKAKCSIASQDCKETVGHHGLPKECREEFIERFGLDVDDYIVEMDKAIPQKLHGTWNQEWRQFLNDPTITKDDVLNQLKKMFEDRGLPQAISCLFGSMESQAKR